MPVIPEFSPAAQVAAPGVEPTMNLMQRAADSRLRQEALAQEIEQKRIEHEIARPVLQATAQATAAEMQTKYNIAISTQQTRAKAYELYKTASDDFDFINLVTDDKQRANLSREWLSRYAQLANVAELKPEMDVKTHLATSNIVDMLKINMLKTAETRSFEALTGGMTDEEKAGAAKVKAGLQARPSSAAIRYQKVTGPDGREMFVAVNPRDVGAEVIGTGQTYGPAFGSRANQPAAQTEQGQPMGAEGQPQVSTPVAPNAFTGQSPGEKTAQEEKAKFEQKLIQEKPKRQAALKMAEVTSDRLTSEIDDLIGKVTKATAGPGGVVLNKFPGTTAKDFESNLNSIKAVIGFQALQAMRDASPTGGALGQVSDFENKLLQSQLGNLEIGQSPTQLVDNLKKVKNRIIENYGITRATFANQYGDGSAAASPSADFKTMSTEQLQQRLNEIRGEK